MARKFEFDFLVRSIFVCMLYFSFLFFFRFRLCFLCPFVLALVSALWPLGYVPCRLMYILLCVQYIYVIRNKLN